MTTIKHSHGGVTLSHGGEPNIHHINIVNGTPAYGGKSWWTNLHTQTQKEQYKLRIY